MQLSWFQPKWGKQKGKRKVQGVPQSQTAALARHLEEEETDKSKQAQTEQTHEKHQDQLHPPQAKPSIIMKWLCFIIVN